MGGVTPFMPAYQNPGRVNADACRTRVPGFICPSDPAPTPPDWEGQNNYYANQGTQFMCDLSNLQPSTVAPNEQPNGPFYFLSTTPMADFTDGLTK